MQKFPISGSLFFVLLSLSGCKKLATQAVEQSPAAAAPSQAPPAASVETSAAAAAAPVAELDAGAAPAATASAAVKAVAAADPKGSKASAPAIPFIGGESWFGSYQCGGKTSTLSLRIKKSTGNTVSAIFDFKTHDGTAGSYNMSGTFIPATHRLALNAESWIHQPNGFVTVNLDGTVSPDNRAFAGRALAAGCTTFLVRR
jgi:nucleoid-associated protein YgaU